MQTPAMTDRPEDRETGHEPCPRAKKLLDLYLGACSSASNEFPYWYTRRYMALDNEVPVVRRALALKEAFSHLTPSIFPGELVAMGKTRHYRGSFPMPWLSESYYMTHESELYKQALERGGASADGLAKFGSGGGNVTRSFGRVVSIAGKFGMRQEEVPAMLETARAWVGKSVEDLSRKYEGRLPGAELKSALMRSIVCMFDSGYTLPQGREVVNYYYPLQHGLDGLIRLCAERKAAAAGNAGGDGLSGMDRLYFYEAAGLVLEGLQAWIENHAREARRLEALELSPVQKAEYSDLAARLERVAHHPPETFAEALQLCWTLHAALLDEDCISGLSPGRLGQVLYPYWKRDTEAGRLSREGTLELLECLRVKFTCLDCFASAGVVGGVLSGNTFNNLCLGGLDRDGGSAANELEELIVEAGKRCRTPQPTLTMLYDEKLPEPFLLKAVESNKLGTGYPAWVNNRTAMKFLLENYKAEGMGEEEARAWSIGGCLETSPGTWMPLTLAGETWWIPGGSGQPTSVGVHFLSLPKILELVLFDGVDQRTKERVFAPHGKTLGSYSELWAVFQDYFRQAVEVLTRANNIQHDIWRKNNMAVLNSLLKPDCLDKGLHIGQLGYRYNATFNVETCGTVNLVNSLAALKKLVYDERHVALEDLRAALKENFGYRPAEETGSYSLAEQKKAEGGSRHDRLHRLCLEAPKYGNDDPYADSLLREWEGWFCGMCGEYESLYGKPLYACQISVSSHGPMGAAAIATPDGRLAGTTFADGSMSAYPGTDRGGPYALFESANVWDHSKSQNSQLNLKLHPSAVCGREGGRKLLELTRGYLRKGAFHIQYNVVDSAMLRDAQAHPERYRDLMVRVAGFTQYWVELGKHIQDEVIARTEYKGV